jgi:hypothetical protein
MKVTFEYDVDFVSVPLVPPTIGNCRKCAFYGEWGKLCGCVRRDHRICDTGRAGYFIKNFVHEIPDITGNARLREEKV